MTTCVAAVRQHLPQPHQPRPGVRRLHPPRQARPGLLGDQRQGARRPRGRPRLSPLLQAGRHLPRRPVRGQARPPSTAPPTTSTPPSPSAPPTTASPSATSAPPSPATRSAPAAPGCTASTGSTSASRTTRPPPASRAATCRSSPAPPEARHAGREAPVVVVARSRRRSTSEGRPRPSGPPSRTSPRTAPSWTSPSTGSRTSTPIASRASRSRSYVSSRSTWSCFGPPPPAGNDERSSSRGPRASPLFVTQRYSTPRGRGPP